MDGSFLINGLDLTGTVAVVSGAGRGIGLETSREFIALGATVIIAERDKKLGDLASEVLGPNAFFWPTDVADEDSVQALLAYVTETFGRCDYLVNNAGITDDKTARKMEIAQWDSVIRVNLRGVFLMSQAFGSYMAAEGIAGVIVNLSSVVADGGNVGQANYVAAKAGVIGLSDTLALEWGRYGIRVLCVAPGFTLTDMAKKVPAENRAKIAADTPLGRLGTPAEIAAVIVFLCSRGASFMTRTVVEVNGGFRT